MGDAGGSKSPTQVSPQLGSPVQLPPFLRPPDAKASCPHFVKVAPVIARFDNDNSTAELSLKSETSARVSWRILCNAPTRYLVSPRSGFLGQRDSAKVVIRLLDASKYTRRHMFMLQAKPVAETENNRKMVWKAATSLELLQNTRIRTYKQQPRKQEPASPSLSTASVPSEAPSPVTASAGTDTARVPTPVDEQALNALKEKTAQAIEEKQSHAARMTELVNAVKMQEVELDRLSARAAELNARISTVKAHSAGLRAVRQNRGSGVSKERSAPHIAAGRHH